MLLSSGLTVERDFENGIEDWKVKNEVEADNESVDDDAVMDTYHLDNEAFPVQIISKKD